MSVSQPYVCSLSNQMAIRHELQAVTSIAGDVGIEAAIIWMRI
tara:strand:- start:243 stop:371 length:129 start_codon:yes stop_codon:yes gene_type:complete